MDVSALRRTLLQSCDCLDSPLALPNLQEPTSNLHHWLLMGFHRKITKIKYHYRFSYESRKFTHFSNLRTLISESDEFEKV